MRPILLHPGDNVLVLAKAIHAGQSIEINGAPMLAPGEVAMSPKVARLALMIGEKVLKYGAPIGSMTAAANGRCPRCWATTNSSSPTRPSTRSVRPVCRCGARAKEHSNG